MGRSKDFKGQKRINYKTFFYISGLDNWYPLSDLPIFEEIFGEKKPETDEMNRRQFKRRPFVARLFVSDKENVYEGVCRDISVGGMQVLISDFDAKVGDQVDLNVHPDNSNYSFVASGEIVRFLKGNQGFSFRFHNLSPEAEDAIQKYLSSE